MFLHKLMEITFTKSMHTWSWSDFGDYLIVLLMEHHASLVAICSFISVPSDTIFTTNLPLPLPATADQVTGVTSRQAARPQRSKRLMRLSTGKSKEIGQGDWFLWGFNLGLGQNVIVQLGVKTYRAYSVWGCEQGLGQ